MAAPHLRLCMKKSSCPKNSWQLCWWGIFFLVNNLCKINTSYNRYNVINFIYALNDSNLKIKFKNNYNIILSKGCLLLFPSFFEFEIDSTTITNEQYIISGQLCNENII